MEKNKNKGNIINLMENKLLIIFLVMLMSLAIVSAADFTPQGNITLRNVYNIQNATSVTVGDGSVLVNSSGFFGWLNWDWLTNIPSFTNTHNHAWSNLTDFPVACPSGTFVTNISGSITCSAVSFNGTNGTIPQFQDGNLVDSALVRLSSVIAKSGMFLPVNYVGVDSSGSNDAGYVFGYNNVPVYDWSTFVAEQGKYLHLINYLAGQDAFTIGQSGRIGVNKPSNVINYHNGFSGTGLDDMSAGGTYTGGFNDGVEINVTSVGSPNNFSYRITVQNGVTSTTGSWSAPIQMSLTPTTIYKGITVKWDSVTGHTLGDKWNFNAFPANPTGTFTIKPTIYDEVSYYNGSAYRDYTSPAATSALGSFSNNPFIIFNRTGQYLYVGRYVKYSSSQFGISVPATGLTLSVDYWNGTAWTPISPVTNYLTDGTANLTKTGGINWDNTALTNWQTNVSVDTYNSTVGIYWVRYGTTTNGTAPMIDSVTPQAISRLAIYQAGYDINPVFNIAPNGDTEITGTLKANGFYGEIWDATSRPLTLTTQNVWYNYTLFNNAGAELSGWSAGTGNLNYTLVNVQPGLYLVTYTLSTSLNQNENAQFGIMINGTVEPKSTTQKRFSTGQTDVISQTFLKHFNTGDRIWLVAQELDSSGKVLTTLNKNVVVTRIGN